MFGCEQCVGLGAGSAGDEGYDGRHDNAGMRCVQAEKLYEHEEQGKAQGAHLAEEVLPFLPKAHGAPGDAVKQG